MDIICESCTENYGEGNICRSCRNQFKVLSVNDEKFENCLKCQNCDMYWFPCVTCAREAFNYRLGKGNSPSKEFEGVLSFEEMFQVLEMKQKETTDLDFESFYLIESIYCSIQ